MPIASTVTRFRLVSFQELFPWDVLEKIAALIQLFFNALLFLFLLFRLLPRSWLERAWLERLRAFAT